MRQQQYKTYIILSIACLLSFIFGVIFLSIQNGWIIIRYPSYQQDIKQQKASMLIKRKPITYFYYKNDDWHIEKSELLWTPDIIKNTRYLLNSYLSYLDEEGFMQKKVTVSHIISSHNEHDLYISFDRNLLHKEDSVFQKWMFIEGILKTIRFNNIPIQHIYFMVHHKPMHDPHLDFENPWPVAGYSF